jgi:rRNA maturation endonuclease Nob1
MANRLNISIGDMVRRCSSCDTLFSNHLRSCPHCGGCNYLILELTPEIEREIGY